MALMRSIETSFEYIYIYIYMDVCKYNVATLWICSLKKPQRHGSLMTAFQYTERLSLSPARKMQPLTVPDHCIGAGDSHSRLSC